MRDMFAIIFFIVFVAILAFFAKSYDLPKAHKTPPHSVIELG